MFHSRRLNNRIDHIHEWALRIIYKIRAPLLKNYLEKTDQMPKAKVILRFERSY